MYGCRSNGNVTQCSDERLIMCSNDYGLKVEDNVGTMFVIFGSQDIFWGDSGSPGVAPGRPGWFWEPPGAQKHQKPKKINKNQSKILNCLKVLIRFLIESLYMVG